jgi:hypothetical protein
MIGCASTLLAWADAQAADSRLTVREGDGLTLWQAGEGAVLRGVMSKHKEAVEIRRR